MTRRVFIAVTHLLGAGHLTRAAALARAFASAGHDVTLTCGGLPVPLARMHGVALVQLPPVKVVGTDFRTLLDETGQPVGPAYLEERRRALLDAFLKAAPDILITELFPFGRRVLAHEFLALLGAARDRPHRPIVAASIRDILARPKPDRIRETYARLSAYDAVLIHGDPDLVPLDLSWPADALPEGLVQYTGYVDEGAGAPDTWPERSAEIVVSGGSSPAGLPLFSAAIGAAALVPDRPWRLLVGRGIDERSFDELRRAAPTHVTVEGARPDFRQLLSGAAVSVSQAGYNTVVDLLRTGTRAILVPFEAGHETEQRLRGERLAAAGLAQLVPETQLSGTALAEAVRARLKAPPPPKTSFRLDGAATSVATVERLAAARASASSPPRQAQLDWSPLDDALRRAKDGGRSIEFWWRDDDAVAHTPALDRLIALARHADLPLALAAIPARLEASLARRIADEPRVRLLVHGLSHANHALPKQKKAEFGADRSLPVLKAEAELALHKALTALGDRALPVFVPPWNRVDPSLAAVLPRAGYRGLSTFGNRDPVRGLVVVNTHLDPIDWRGGRRLLDRERLVVEFAATVATLSEPIGLLTHHLIQDEAVWDFCEALLDRLRTHATLRYPATEDLFRLTKPADAMAARASA